MAVENTPAATRLCSACGLCCNGVMFHTVRLQPSDSVAELTALGLRLKRKKGAQFLLQPCTAFRGSHCSVYEARPERCRRFECRQLKQVESGQISESAALEKIRDVQQRVEVMSALLAQSGRTDPKKPLSKRLEKIIAEPVHDSSGQAAVELRATLTRTFQELDAILDRDFRVTSVRVVPDDGDAP